MRKMRKQSPFRHLPSPSHRTTRNMPFTCRKCITPLLSLPLVAPPPVANCIVIQDSSHNVSVTPVDNRAGINNSSIGHNNNNNNSNNDGNNIAQANADMPPNATQTLPNSNNLSCHSTLAKSFPNAFQLFVASLSLLSGKWRC